MKLRGTTDSILPTTNLDQLQGESIYILREAFERIAKLALPGAPGEDSKILAAPAGRVAPRDLFAVEHRVTAADRARMNAHRGGILWFTGLSAAGKSTLAVELERQLFSKGYQVFLLDGDNLRHGLNADLGFAPRERTENIRRVGEVAALFAEAGMIVISAFISPYRVDRERVRTAHREHFHEVYINASLQSCEARDPKGLYRRARAGELKDFTGVSAPYEPPEAPELEIRTDAGSVHQCLSQLLQFVEHRFSKGRRKAALAEAR